VSTESQHSTSVFATGVSVTTPQMLWECRYGRRILIASAGGSVCPVGDHSAASYQWLPCEKARSASSPSLAALTD
jgi:hypothetical protein